MSLTASLTWKNNMHFVGQSDQYLTDLDASNEFGGTGKGATPKQLLLKAMMGCTALDVISILQKMRLPVKSFTMNISAEKNKLPPIHFTKVLLTYNLEGEIPVEKAVKAIDSSLTKHCGVNYMISKVAEISYILKINGTVSHEGKAAFIDPAE